MLDLKVLTLKRCMGEALIFEVKSPCTFMVLVDKGKAAGVKLVTVAPQAVEVSRAELLPAVAQEMEQAIQNRTQGANRS